MSDSYVIIGDGIAGSSAAETIREEDPDAEITIITDEGEPLYNRILTKEFAKGKLPEAPVSIHEEDWYEERDIDLRLNTLVTDVDDEENVATPHDGETLEFDKLLAATGGTPMQVPVENSDADGIHHFWTFQDARAIAEDAENGDKAIIVGAGLLGIDFAGICAAHDVEAKYIMRGSCWWRYACRDEGAEMMHQAMRDIDVEPVLESGVERFEVDDDGHVTGAVDGNGNFHEADWVGVGIGLHFNTEFLQDTDVTTNWGIEVDEYMQTDVDDIYAAGDVTKFYDTILEEQNQNGSWGSAKNQGRVAGLNMVHGHGEEEFQWVPNYSITHFEFPFLSLGHPTLGSDGPVTESDPHGYAKTYGENEWRRLAFKDGALVGAVLIGDLSVQSQYKQLIRDQRQVEDQVDVLLEADPDLDKLDAPKQHQ